MDEIVSSFTKTTLKEILKLGPLPLALVDANNTKVRVFNYHVTHGFDYVESTDGQFFYDGRSTPERMLELLGFQITTGNNKVEVRRANQADFRLFVYDGTYEANRRRLYRDIAACDQRFADYLGGEIVNYAPSGEKRVEAPPHLPETVTGYFAETWAGDNVVEQQYNDLVKGDVANKTVLEAEERLHEGRCFRVGRRDNTKALMSAAGSDNAYDKYNDVGVEGSCLFIHDGSNTLGPAAVPDCTIKVLPVNEDAVAEFIATHETVYDTVVCDLAAFHKYGGFSHRSGRDLPVAYYGMDPSLTNRIAEMVFNSKLGKKKIARMAVTSAAPDLEIKALKKPRYHNRELLVRHDPGGLTCEEVFSSYAGTIYAANVLRDSCLSTGVYPSRLVGTVTSPDPMVFYRQDNIKPLPPGPYQLMQRVGHDERFNDRAEFSYMDHFNLVQCHCKTYAVSQVFDLDKSLGQLVSDTPNRGRVIHNLKHYLKAVSYEAVEMDEDVWFRRI